MTQCFIIRCCLFNHSLFTTLGTPLPQLWIVVFPMCNTDLSLFSQAFCRKEGFHRQNEQKFCLNPTSALSLDIFSWRRWTLDFCNMPVFHNPLYPGFAGNRLCFAVCFSSANYEVLIWRFYTLGGAWIRFLITVALTVESHDTIRVFMINQHIG